MFISSSRLSSKLGVSLPDYANRALPMTIDSFVQTSVDAANVV